MSLTILLLLLFVLLLLVYGWRSRYFMLFAFLVLSTAVSMLMLLTEVARNSNYIVPSFSLARPLETRLFALCREYLHLPLSTLMLIRNVGITAYFGGIVCFVLSFSSSLRLDNTVSRRRPWHYVLLIGLPVLFFAFFHPQTAFWFFRRYHSLPTAQARESAVSALYTLTFLMTGAVLVYLLWPVLYLLVDYRRGRMTFLSHFHLHLAIPLLVLNLCFFLLFFVGIFRPSCEDVIRYGFWRFSMPTQMPLFHTTVLPIVSFIVLVVLFIPLMRLQADHVLSFFKFRGIRRNLDALYANVRNVMHSEKNLLFTIRIIAEDALAQKEEGEREERLQRIVDLCGQNLDDLTRTLTDAHDMSVSTMRNDFIQAVKSVLEQLRIPETVKVTCSFPGDTLPLFFDLYHMTHAVSNILSNSLEALSAARPAEPEIRLTIHTSRTWVYFSVWDNGCGIPRKILHKVEQPYVSTKKKKNSWGIGLSYVFSVIRAHYGQMHIRSRQDEYTLVEILLPRTRKGGKR